MVRRGETLGSLARRYHVSIAKLKQWNGPLKIIRIGQTIVTAQSGFSQPYGHRSKSRDRSRKVAQSGTNNNDSSQGI
jgi:LysM repeat protein